MEGPVQEPDSERAKRAPGAKYKVAIVILVIVALLAAGKYFNAQERLREALAWIEGLGVRGPAVFVALYILACVLLVPGSLLTLGAGSVFGLLKGFVCVSLGSTLGATLAFLVGRYFARDWVASRVAQNEKFSAIDQAVGREGWKIVGLTRLSPIFPFNLLNYAFGLTSVSLRDYFLASWIGMMPGTVMYVYLGALVGDLARIGGEKHARTPGEWALYVVGLVATVAVTVYVTRIARTALQERIT